MGEARKLAAIMAVDVVGYSRLMGEDEAGTAKAVREHRNVQVARRPGRSRPWAVGVLLSSSVVAAVDARLRSEHDGRAQRRYACGEADRLCVGVHLGES